MTEQAYIFDAIRSPRGRGRAGGALNEVKPVTLLAGVLNQLRTRNDLDTAQVDDIVMGCVSALGDQGADLAKIAAAAAGWDDDVAGVTLNRFCGSGLEAVNLAAAKVRSGFEDLVVAGGFESMSRVPMGSAGGAMANDPETSLGINYVPQGVGADLIATLEGFSRADADAYAVESHRRAAHAWASGYFDRSVVPVLDRNGLLILGRDECIRPDSNLESLARLKPAFEKPGQGAFDAICQARYPQVDRVNHVHTGGNSSGIVDGAAALLIGSGDKGRALGLTPRARIVSAALVGTDPTLMLTGPAPAARKALAKAGLGVDDIDLFEVNEAFASVVLKFQKELGVASDRVNVNGGAIAMGHPLGATGAMLLGTLLDELERRQQRYGLATLCIAGGMGIATIIERV